MGLDYFPSISVPTEWGKITGEIEEQLDLANALAEKAAADHSHSEFESADPEIQLHIANDLIHIPSTTGNNGKVLLCEDEEPKWQNPPAPPPLPFFSIVKKITDLALSTTSFITDSELSFTAPANQLIAFNLNLVFKNYESGSRTIEVRMKLPSGASGNWYVYYFNGANGYVRGCMPSGSTNFSNVTTAATPPTVSTANELMIFADGVIDTGDGGDIEVEFRTTSAASNGVGLLPGSRFIVYF